MRSIQAEFQFLRYSVVLFPKPAVDVLSLYPATQLQSSPEPVQYIQKYIHQASVFLKFSVPQLRIDNTALCEGVPPRFGMGNCAY